MTQLFLTIDTSREMSNKINTLTPHILIVDDDLILQSYLKIKFSQQGYKITQATQGEDIGSILKTHTIHIIILDVILTGKDGVYWLKWLKLYHSDMSILMLTSQNSSDDRVHALELGALDYLSKPFHIKELLIRIENILKHSPSLQLSSKKRKASIKFGDYIFDIKLNTLTKLGRHIKLTHCETELLAVLCQHPDKVVTRDQLAQALSGKDHLPLDRRIDVHINRLRNKIETKSSSPLFIRTVWGKGYQFYTSLV